MQLSAPGDERIASQLANIVRSITSGMEEMRAWWPKTDKPRSRRGTKAKAVLTAEPAVITEIMCSTSSENDVEQLAHGAVVDDSVPQRTLKQEVALPAQAGDTVETTPAVTATNVNAQPPIYDFADEADQTIQNHAAYLTIWLLNTLIKP